jgi:hypothetical protein
VSNAIRRRSTHLPGLYVRVAALLIFVIFVAVDVVLVIIFVVVGIIVVVQNKA